MIHFYLGCLNEIYEVHSWRASLPSSFAAYKCHAILSRNYLQFIVLCSVLNSIRSPTANLKISKAKFFSAQTIEFCCLWFCSNCAFCGSILKLPLTDSCSFLLFLHALLFYLLPWAIIFTWFFRIRPPFFGGSSCLLGTCVEMFSVNMFEFMLLASFFLFFLKLTFILLYISFASCVVLFCYPEVFLSCTFGCIWLCLSFGAAKR